MSKTPSAHAADETGSVAPLDAPTPTAFAAKQIDTNHITVCGPAWAEYHLLISAPTESQPFARILSEAHAPGGAPVVAFLLARWCEQEDPTRIVTLHLEIGSGPNGRLLRREIEKRAPNFPNLHVQYEPSADTAETYRILHWACEHTGAAGEPLETPVVRTSIPYSMQHGEIDAQYEVSHARGKYLQASREQWDDAVYVAARAWAAHNDEEAAEIWARGAQQAWGTQVLARRWECALSWSDVVAGIGSLKDQEESGEKLR